MTEDAHAHATFTEVPGPQTGPLLVFVDGHRQRLDLPARLQVVIQLVLVVEVEQAAGNETVGAGDLDHVSAKSDFRIGLANVSQDSSEQNAHLRDPVASCTAEAVQGKEALAVAH